MKFSTLALLLALMFFGSFIAFPASEHNTANLFLAMYFVGVMLICMVLEQGETPK